MQINNFDKVISDVQKLHESIDKLKEDLKNLNKESSEIDRHVNNFYHIIELVSLDACELSQLMSKLKQTLKRRREVKEMIICLQAVLSGTASDLKKIEAFKINAEERNKKYKKEALFSYTQITGKIKKS